MRSIMRHRANLVAAAAEQVQLMQKALQQMNILLHHVVSDLDGQTGLRILDAIIAGERDPQPSRRTGRSLPTSEETRIRFSKLRSSGAAHDHGFQDGDSVRQPNTGVR